MIQATKWFLCVMMVIASTNAGLLCADQEGESSSDPVLELVGKMTHPELREVSGIEFDQSQPGVWWAINDSGCEPKVYRMDRWGEIIVDNDALDDVAVGFELTGAVNVDWEDLTIYNGMLVVPDMGNNWNARQNLGIYFAELPSAEVMAGPLEILRHVRVRYPDQETFPATQFEFDCEAVFYLDGKLHVLTKQRMGQTKLSRIGTKLYRLDKEDEEVVNELTLVDRHETIGPWVTGADVSPEGDRLAVLTQFEVWIFERPEDSDKWLSEGKATRVKLPRDLAKQAEAICWDDIQTLRIANEQREIYTLDVRLCDEEMSADALTYGS